MLYEKACLLKYLYKGGLSKVLNNTNKTQLNRIAEYIDTLFGVVNENGVIEYCSAGDTLPGKIQQISEKVSDVILSAKSDTYNASFFTKNDILFHNITVDEDEERFLFIQLSETTNEEYGKRLLGLAAFAIECSNQQNNKNVMSLFRLPSEIKYDVARDTRIVHESDLSSEGLTDACVLCSVLLCKLEVTGSLSLKDES